MTLKVKFQDFKSKLSQLMGKAAFAQPRYPQANVFNFMAVLAQEVEVASLSIMVYLTQLSEEHVHLKWGTKRGNFRSTVVADLVGSPALN